MDCAHRSRSAGLGTGLTGVSYPASRSHSAHISLQIIPLALRVDWLLHEQKILLGKLKTLPAIREAIGLQVIAWGWEGGEAKAASVILWWLDQTCPECHGTRYETVQGTNRHSAKACRSCGGTGKRTLPHGQEGKRLANLLDDCVSRARVQMKRALRFRAG